MLTLTFLGVGCAFSKRNFQSNALLEAWTKDPDQQAAPDDVLLIDFGATAPRALDVLRRAPGFGYIDAGGRVNFAAIRRVFITHLHADHIGGLEELAIQARYAAPAKPNQPPARPTLVSSADVLTMLWERSLRGGLEASAGGIPALQSYFNVQPLAEVQDRWLEPFQFGDRYVIRPFATDHMRIHRPFDWPSFGLLIEDTYYQQTALFSGDTRFDPDFLSPLMRNARVCFHEVQLASADDPVHTTADQLRRFDEIIQRRTFLYHFDDDWDSGEHDALARETAGWALPLKRYAILSDI